MTRSPARHRGLTLAECLMACALLALVVAAVSQAVLAGQTQTQHALHAQRAVTLAEALLEEILSLPYADPQGAAAAGPDAGESGRAQFDNADDYHGWSEQPGALRDLAGNLYPSPFQGFRRTVSAVYTSVSVSGFAQAVAGLNIVVTVTDARNQSWRVERFLPAPAP